MLACRRIAGPEVWKRPGSSAGTGRRNFCTEVTHYVHGSVRFAAGALLDAPSFLPDRPCNFKLGWKYRRRLLPSWEGASARPLGVPELLEVMHMVSSVCQKNTLTVTWSW